jgi:hypothetical protein
MLRRIIAFVVAVAVLIVLGSLTQSLFVQAAWSRAAAAAEGGAAAAIPFADRIAWAGHDLAGILVPYGAVTSITLLTSLLAAGAVAHFTGRRVMIFGIASAIGIFALFTIIRQVVGTVGIFGVRGPFGLAAQMAVACVAGALFAQITRSRA